MKILSTHWFTPMGGSLIGIVTTEDEITGDRQAYIGTADGDEEDIDADHIARTGAKFYMATAQAIISTVE